MGYISLENEDPSFNWTDLEIQRLRYRYYRLSRLRHGRRRDLKYRVKSNNLASRGKELSCYS